MKPHNRHSPVIYLPLALVVVIAFGLPVVATFDVPFERPIKEFVGIEYSEPGCAPIRDRGRFGAWRREGRLPTPIDELRAARVGAAAYLVGGIVTPVVDNFGRSTSAFRRFDLRSRRTTDLSPLPEALNHVGVAAHRGSIYVVGGLGNRLEYRSEGSRSMWRYDIADRRWHTLAPMSVGRGALGAAFIGETLYAVGGRSGPRSLPTVEAYDVKRGAWTQRAPLPSGRDHLGVATLDGKLYAAGGRYDGGEEMRDFLRYDPGANRWTALPPIPEGKSGVNLERVGNQLVITGGEDSEQAWLTGNTVAFDPRTNRWQELPPSPLPRHGYASVGYRDRLYVFGGAACAGGPIPTATIESLRVGDRR